MTRRKVGSLILGGGAAGLSAHHFLRDSLIVERSSVAGGGCKVVPLADGSSYSLGPRKLRYRGDTQAIVDEVLDSFGVDRSNVVEERSLVRYGDRYIRFPFQHNLRDLPVGELLSCVYGFMRRPKSLPVSFNQWARAKYGHKIAESVVIPHSERSWKRSSHDISLKATAKVMEGGLREFLKGVMVGTNIKDKMVYIEGGVAELFSRMVPDDILLGANVPRAGIDLRNHRVLVQSEAGGQVIDYDTLVSTIPLPAFHHLVDEDLPQDVEVAFELLDYNTLYIVYIVVDLAGYTGPRDVRMIYYPERGPVFHRIAFPTQDGVDSGSPYVPIVAEVTMDRKYRRLAKSAEWHQRLTHRVIGDMVSCGLITDWRHVHATDISVVNPGYILFDEHYERSVGLIQQYFRDRNVWFLGRFAEWNNLEIDTTFKRAKSLAREIENGRKN